MKLYNLPILSLLPLTATLPIPANHASLDDTGPADKNPHPALHTPDFDRLCRERSERYSGSDHASARWCMDEDRWGQYCKVKRRFWQGRQTAPAYMFRCPWPYKKCEDLNSLIGLPMAIQRLWEDFPLGPLQTANRDIVCVQEEEDDFDKMTSEDESEPDEDTPIKHSDVVFRNGTTAPHNSPTHVKSRVFIHGESSGTKGPSDAVGGIDTFTYDAYGMPRFSGQKSFTGKDIDEERLFEFDFEIPQNQSGFKVQVETSFEKHSEPLTVVTQFVHVNKGKNKRNVLGGAFE